MKHHTRHCKQAKWARRQHSHIWAPDLAEYTFSLVDSSSGGGGLHDSIIGAIAEGQLEGKALFTAEAMRPSSSSVPLDAPGAGTITKTIDE